MEKLIRTINNDIRNALIFRGSSFPILSSFIQPYQPFSSKEIHRFDESGIFNVKTYQFRKEIVQKQDFSEENFINLYELMILNDDINSLKSKVGEDLFNCNQIIDIKNGIGDSLGKTLIELCCQYNAKNCFFFLLSLNPILARRNENMEQLWGPIEYAAANGNISFIKFLEEKGEKREAVTLAAAGIMHENETLKWLIDGNQIHDFQPALFGCILSSNIEGILLLLQSGADVNIQYGKGNFFI